MNIPYIRSLLQQFRFAELFNELGWGLPGKKSFLPVVVPLYENLEPGDLVSFPPSMASSSSSATKPGHSAAKSKRSSSSPSAAVSRSTISKPKAVIFQPVEIAQLGGVKVIELIGEDVLPNAKILDEVHEQITSQCHENVLVFVTSDRTQSLLYWKKYRHPYFKGQPGDLFLSKLASLEFTLDDFEKAEKQGLNVMDVVNRLHQALDVTQVTKDFYSEFQAQHDAFVQLIQGLDKESEKKWYASVVLSRLMFIYFLQEKKFLDRGQHSSLDHGKCRYLQDKLDQSKSRGTDLYYRTFLRPLFFEGFAKPANERRDETKELLGDIPYLNGGLFLQHDLEQKYGEKIQIPDIAFEHILEVFQEYSWYLDDGPIPFSNSSADQQANSNITLDDTHRRILNPSVLGYIFEKYITSQKSSGAYYTCSEITNYLCEQTIDKVILEKVNERSGDRKFNDLPDLLSHLTPNLCQRLVCEILPEMSILDPACGSGAFLLAAMENMLEVYMAIVSKRFFEEDTNLQKWREDLLNNTYPTMAYNSRGYAETNAHGSKKSRLIYAIKKQIITNNLFGVDIMQEATEIARLRLFLALVASVETVEELEPLPNIDFNIMTGNSLIGLMHVASKDFETMHSQGNWLENYAQRLKEKQDEIAKYSSSHQHGASLAIIRNRINGLRQQAMPTLHELLREEFKELKIKFEEVVVNSETAQATASIQEPDEVLEQQETFADPESPAPKSKKKARCKKRPDNGQKRPVKIEDIAALQPFHWGYEFPTILEQRGGFDVIVTNPPWEIFKPQAKEFFDDYCDSITKNKMTIHDFEREQERLLQNPEIRKKWQEYLSLFPHVNIYFRSAHQYANQISKVRSKTSETGQIKEKKAGTDLNLYKLFVEQCYNLLRPHGQCGMVVPSGIYTDLGTKQLRILLLEHTQITGLFCFENRKKIFEGVDSRFKFVVLSFQKEGATQQFPAAFMRHDVQELAQFPRQGSVSITKDLIQRLSPDSLSIMEFKNKLDFSIAEKMLQFPLLREKLPGAWCLVFSNELHMSHDKKLFQTRPGVGCLPLYEGKMIHQFDAHFALPRYWVNEQQGRARVLGQEQDAKQLLDYQSYRLGFRRVAASTNERTMIMSMIPRLNFCADTVSITIHNRNHSVLLYSCALLNSFVLDYLLRQKVSSTVNFFYLYQLPIPRLSSDSPWFAPIVTRAARLICTTPEFDDLAQEVGLEKISAALPQPIYGITDPAARQALRAELDALVALLYNLTPSEFEYILSTFPQVDTSIKIATLSAYRQWEGNLPELGLSAPILPR